MAEHDENGKKRRIRKSAPTIRERTAIAQAQAERGPRFKRVRRAGSSVKRPLTKLKPRLPDNGLTRPIKKVGRILAKVLGWLAPRYFINSWREVRQVTWPSRKETIRLTTAVFVFAIVFGTVVYGVDRGLDELFKKVILKS